ncbi:hypothetical protein ACRE_087970 [Hapsidospora chrysogenum ATCC 11550]|uniref:Uncharacterized protein n=1 Tax=Hapsidospora chrysogenum (strain ATCC 11550 / CBS 779.69 / DSM 880 / IAM 14645 / JCM 23072 / IMI 49137) TaxID=857340 RepID=A0A086STT4_HAPC1|nr:hypothetical protein ACRE_087970 [Hapsidospora chrysogenum ATCC 11550]
MGVQSTYSTGHHVVHDDETGVNFRKQFHTNQSFPARGKRVQEEGGGGRTKKRVTPLVGGRLVSSTP